MKTLTTFSTYHNSPTRVAKFARYLTMMLYTAVVLLALVVAPGAAHAGIYNTLHDFPSFAIDGSQPIGALVEDPLDGAYYGTTRYGGQFGQGAVFHMDPATFVVTIIHSFSVKDGANPTCTLILVPAASGTALPGTLYGTTLNGGAHSLGTVFKVETNGAAFQTLYSFKGGADGANPFAGVIMASDHHLYGTTLRGGRYGLGTVYRINSLGIDAVIHHFAGTSVPGMVDGATPYARLLQIDGDGNLVGTTARGGIQNNGVVYRIGLTGAPYGLLHLFGGSPDGAHPMSEVIQVVDPTGLNMLYGTTFNGGGYATGAPLNQGTVYRLNEAGGSYSTVYSFGANGATDGHNPFGALVAVPSANGPVLHGTTLNGGTFNLGTVYYVSPAPVSPEWQIYSFMGLMGPVDDGANPYSALIQSKVDGLLYGTCAHEGTDGDGTVYHISP